MSKVRVVTIEFEERNLMDGEDLEALPVEVILDEGRVISDDIIYGDEMDEAFDWG